MVRFDENAIKTWKYFFLKLTRKIIIIIIIQTQIENI